jgi:hypothetical protein
LFPFSKPLVVPELGSKLLVVPVFKTTIRVVLDLISKILVISIFETAGVVPELGSKLAHYLFQFSKLLGTRLFPKFEGSSRVFTSE